MKRYVFFIIALSAVLLPACSDNNSGTNANTGIVPYITTMPPLTSTEPPDTYEQYRATYTPTVTQNGSPFTILGVAADTAATPPAMGTVTAVTDENGQTSAPETVVPSADTAAVFTIKISEQVTEKGGENTSGISSSESGTSDVTSTQSENTITAPPADTANFQDITADTSPTKFKTETSADTNTSNGGTDNAN